MKYILVTLISLFSFSIFSQELSPEDSISILLLNQEYEKAIHQCENILMYDSTASWAWAPMGQAKLKLLRYKDALNDFKKAEKHFPDNLSVKYSQGNAYSKLGDHAKASATYQSIIETDSTQLFACIELAKSYYNGKKYSDALSIYQDLVKKDPRNYAFNKELGLTYLKLDSVKMATWFMHNAISINNRDQDLIAKLTTIHNKEGDYQLALMVVKLGRMHDSISTPLISLEGYCNYLLQDYNSAIRLFGLARSLGDSSDFTAKYMGISYVYVDKESFAIPLLEKVFQADSTANNCYYLGMAHYGSGKYILEEYDTAYHYFQLTQELMEPTPTVKASVYKYMGGCLVSMKKYREALENYKLAYSFDPSEYTVLYSTASIYDHYINDKKMALKYYQQFLERCDFEPSAENLEDKKYVSISKVAYMRVLKIREDLHFEGKLKK